MEYKRLGKTNLKISRVGFGCWAIGGHGYGKVDDQDSIAAIRRALDLGINFFDTADVYGFGHSEEILSKALGGKRNEVIIATKFGVSWDKNSNIGRDCSPKRVVEALNDSLHRLKLDCIPLYQIHWPDTKTPISATMEALKECQEDGKIQYIGCSNFPSDLIRNAQKTARLESLQVPYNILDRNIEGDILSCCQELKMSVLAYSPLAQGLLTGKFRHEVKFDDDDSRGRNEKFQGEKFLANLKLVDKLKEIGNHYNKTPAQVAIRWILDNAYITCAITGIKKIKQIEENIGALDWSLSKEERKLLSTL